MFIVKKRAKVHIFFNLCKYFCVFFRFFLRIWEKSCNFAAE